MPSIEDAKRSNATFKPSYSSIPVAVFFGGTSGVGEAMVKAFAFHVSGRAHVIIIGRNEAVAKKTLDGLPKSEDPNLIRDFISLDFLSMNNLKEGAQALSKRVEKINYLILSAGYGSPFQGRVETKDGLDDQMVARYYHRFKFIYETLPLLRKARDLGEDARVVSVLGAGAGNFTKVNLNDLGLRKVGWKAGVMGAIASVIYNDYALEV
jgi:NAD(P)-dependent dehydrogenase (short-subunit alcohol dehydrogenase family)